MFYVVTSRMFEVKVVKREQIDFVLTIPVTFRMASALYVGEHFGI